MTGRILVVDDIATNRVILRAKLAASYYEVIQA
jgi:two-component system cell cycle response regulator